MEDAIDDDTPHGIDAGSGSRSTTGSTEESDADASRRRIAERLAGTSAAAGLVVCCPVATLIAPVIGLAALLVGRGLPDRPTESGMRWRTLARVGIAFGVAGSILSVAVLLLGRARWERDLRVTYTGPNNALIALEAGASEAFRDEFLEREAGDEAAFERLRADVAESGGLFVRAFRAADDAGDPAPPDAAGAIPYDVQFGRDESRVDGVARCVIVEARDERGRLVIAEMALEIEGVVLRWPPAGD